MTASAAPVTAKDIMSEHVAALESLTLIQRRAIDRWIEARTMATYGAPGTAMRLARICDIEAESRNGCV